MTDAPKTLDEARRMFAERGDAFKLDPRYFQTFGDARAIDKANREALYEQFKLPPLLVGPEEPWVKLAAKLGRSPGEPLNMPRLTKGATWDGDGAPWAIDTLPGALTHRVGLGWRDEWRLRTAMIGALEAAMEPTFGTAAMEAQRLFRSLTRLYKALLSRKLSIGAAKVDIIAATRYWFDRSGP